MIRPICILVALASAAGSAAAADFFSKEEPENLFTLGVRAGINTSNRTIGNPTATLYNFQSWGTGFTAGVIADLHIRDYLAIEPGVFLESRSGHSSFIAGRNDDSNSPYYVTQEAHRHTYNLNVPVIASVRLNLSDRLRWHIDFGPYIAFLLKSKMENKELISTRPDLSNEVPFSTGPSKVDFGFKMGTGFELSRHLYFGIHYEAGAVKAYRNKDMGDHLLMTYGGRTKAWNFTLGWNF